MARILVVDDEVDMRMALGNVLSRMGHQVFEAGDGPTALDFLAREGVDLVLLDIRMPGMDGVQILRKFRETDKTTPVVMVTGYGSVDSAVEALQLGASQYLAKPFSNRELVEMVERVLQEKTAPGSSGVLGKRLAEKLRGAIAPVEPRAVRAPEGAPPEARVRHDRSWALPAVLLVGAAAGLAAWALHSGRAGRDVRIPFKNPTGLVWQGGTLWSADWVTQTVYQMKVSRGGVRLLRSVLLPGVHVTGVAVAGEHVYLCDSWKKEIQKRRLDDKLTLVRTYKSPGPNPTGLHWDGRYLWSSDGTKDRFYQHEPEAGLAVLASYRAPGKAPAGIFKDEEFFWSADSETRLIYKHRLDRKLGILAVYSLPLLNPGSEPLSSFTLKGDEIWVARDGSDVLHVRSERKFVKLDKGESQ